MHKPKIKFTPHARKRLYERVTGEVSIFDIINGINNKSIVAVKKMTLTRSLYYGMVENSPVKAIFSKSNKKVITILPFAFDYNFINGLDIKGESYKLEIFPDCYMETDNCLLLTKFFKSINGEWIKEKMSVKTCFDEAFSKTWEKYNLFKQKGVEL